MGVKLIENENRLLTDHLPVSQLERQVPGSKQEPRQRLNLKYVEVERGFFRKDFLYGGPRVNSIADCIFMGFHRCPVRMG